MAFQYEQVKDIVVCPVTRDELVHEADALVSVNPERRLSYPIVDDIPRLLEEEARELDPDAWGQVMARHNRDAKTGQPV